MPTGVQVADVFTTNERETCIRVTPWGFLGDTWPYFRPNFVNMEEVRAEAGVDEVMLQLPSHLHTEAATAVLLSPHAVIVALVAYAGTQLQALLFEHKHRSQSMQDSRTIENQTAMHESV